MIKIIIAIESHTVEFICLKILVTPIADIFLAFEIAFAFEK